MKGEKVVSHKIAPGVTEYSDGRLYIKGKLANDVMGMLDCLKITKVRLSDCPVVDWLGYLKGFPNISAIELFWCDCGDAVAPYSQIAEMKGLEEVSISAYGELDADTFASILKLPNLKSLGLIDLHVENLDLLAKVTNVKRLKLGLDLYVDDLMFLKQMHGLEHLDLSYCGKVDLSRFVPPENLKSFFVPSYTAMKDIKRFSKCCEVSNNKGCYYLNDRYRFERPSSRLCETCGRTFTTKNPKEVFCSDECAKCGKLLKDKGLPGVERSGFAGSAVAACSFADKRIANKWIQFLAERWAEFANSQWGETHFIGNYVTSSSRCGEAVVKNDDEELGDDDFWQKFHITDSKSSPVVTIAPEDCLSWRKKSKQEMSVSNGEIDLIQKVFMRCERFTEHQRQAWRVVLKLSDVQLKSLVDFIFTAKDGEDTSSRSSFVKKFQRALICKSADEHFRRHSTCSTIPDIREI